mgnify:CR=1 FL=1
MFYSLNLAPNILLVRPPTTFSAALATAPQGPGIALAILLSPYKAFPTPEDSPPDIALPTAALAGPATDCAILPKFKPVLALAVGASILGDRRPFCIACYFKTSGLVPPKLYDIFDKSNMLS